MRAASLLALSFAVTACGGSPGSSDAPPAQPGGGGGGGGAAGEPDAGSPDGGSDKPDEPGDPNRDPCEGVECSTGETCQRGFCFGLFPDDDGDGFDMRADCDDADPAVHPDAEEVCDGFDNDCDGSADEDFDQDGDGFPGPACEGTGARVDCDDSDRAKSPATRETCDGLDNDCDGRIDEGFDADLDGFSTCGDGPVDCDDADHLVRPGGTEYCDGKDNDCNGQTDEGDVCSACSDGQRDELVDPGSFPLIAGCAGTFGRSNLRAERTGAACGDDLGVPCAVPEDLCSPGWHICLREGRGRELRERISTGDCLALTRPWATASGNCSNPTDESPRGGNCDLAEPLPCPPTGWCSAPIVCGPGRWGCSAVFADATRVFGLHSGRTENNGCGSVGTDVFYADRDQGSLAGILCCADVPAE